MSVDLDLSPVLKVLAEPIRLRIVELLATEDMCVCHLVEELDEPQPLVSHHLKVLREAGVLSAARYRYWTYYSLDADALRVALDGLAHVIESAGRRDGRRRPCC